MFSFISARKAEQGISRMCKALGVSESGYHAYERRPQSPRQRQDTVLGVHIRAAFARSHQSYGSPRMVRELQAQGLKIGRRRVARLMRETGSMPGQGRASFARPTAPIA